MVDDLYQDLILDHFQHPRAQAPIDAPSVSYDAYNPLCGDRIHLALRVENGIVRQVHFHGKGCCISQASASVMSECCEGRSLDELKASIGEYRAMLRGEASEAELVQLGDARMFESVRQYAARVKCALLAWDALERCVDLEQQKQGAQK